METPVPLKDLTFDHRDEFDRKSIAEKVIKLLDAEMDFCPMAIDGGWGTGKTEFCHKLINLIKEQDAQRQKAAQEAAADAARAAENAEEAADAAARADTAAQPTTDGEQTAAQAKALPPERAVIYLDAFASETVDDPLLCILAAIRAEFPDKETRKKISRKAVPVVKTLCKVTGKAVFAHVFKQDLEDVSEAVADAVSDGVNSLIDQTVDKLLDQYADAQENLDALKDVIATAATQRPILFFIDELDRCRPDFALSILELVKHVFDIPGIKFIFVANLEQLKAAIRKRYGQDVDADVYLEKFFKFSFVLLSKFGELPSDSSKHCAFLLLEAFGKENFLKIFYDRYSYGYLYIKKIVEHNDITLRGIQSVIQNMKIYMALRGIDSLKNNDGYLFVILMSIIIFTINKNLAFQYINGDISRESVENFFGEIPDEDVNKNFSIIIESCYIKKDIFMLTKDRYAHIGMGIMNGFPANPQEIIKETILLLNFNG